MKNKKIGAIVLATEQGLGYLAKAFYDHGLIDKVFIHEHTSRTNHREWYEGKDIIYTLEELLVKCDTILFFETPFNWKVIPRAREHGVKTILIPMYECTQYPLPYQPDEVWSPSLLDEAFYGEKSTRRVPIPVGEGSWRLRTEAKVFVHNAGNGGLGGRNGTKELLAAMRYVQSPIKLIIRSQVPLPSHRADERIEYRIGTFTDIWSEGDVFVFPEKFNGLSLPLQEAFAAGMLVMAGARFPMTEWLPKEPLIPVSHYHKERIAVEFDCAEYDPEVIARTIDAWYAKDITKYSLLGKEWGEQNSWKNLQEKFKTLLSQ